jgi:hypothetical protein
MCTFTKYYYGNQIMKKEKAWACNVNGGDGIKMHKKFYSYTEG